MNDLQKLIGDWSSKKTISGKSFDDLFQIEGIPLWWFYKRFFVQNVLPGPINTFSLIEKKQPVNSAQRIKFTVNSFFMKNYSYFLENRKIYYSHRKKLSRADLDKEKVLFLSYSNHQAKDGSVFRLQNFIQKINLDKKLKELLIIADPLSSSNYKNISHHNAIYSYYDPDISSKAWKIARSISKRWNSLPEKTKSIMLEGKNISLWPYLRYAFKVFFSKKFLYVTSLHYQLFKKIIAEQHARAIVLTSNNSLSDKCAMAAAKSANIPVFIIQHGIGGFIGNPDPIGKTTFFVFNQLYKKRLLAHGVKEKDIKIVGPIVFDDIYRFKKAAAPRDTIKTKIFFATSPLIEGSLLTKKKYFRYIAKILIDLQKIKDVSIIVKLHPQEKTLREYRNLVKKKKYTNVTVTQNHDRNLYYRLLSEGDVFIHFNSSASLEALMLDKPVIDIGLPEQKKGNHFTRGTGATTEISLDDPIDETVLKSLQKDAKMKQQAQQAKKLIQHFCGKVDGKAFERAAREVYKII
ncbi:UDP-N-acetylglucosamine 2-epimerase [Candidatus Woesearchaeota archaeon]|nr:UDP-N-acetylglucosamine 2-epimerase [Candidatus Woesearchaeota archaeon]MBI2581540.1 UDP-N-acetylglucosamine 2-epimerase [Candidatus Woesearchaeota archaeon]